MKHERSFIAMIVLSVIAGLAIGLRSCTGLAAETNVLTSPAMVMLSISAEASGSLRIITATGTNPVSRVIRLSTLSIALDQGLVIRQIAGDLWQVTTEEKAARTEAATGVHP